MTTYLPPLSFLLSITASSPETYPADPSDGRGLGRRAIREHLVKVAPKQMHLVSSQIDAPRGRTDGRVPLRSAAGPGGRCGPGHGSRGSSASSRRPIGGPHCEARNLRRHRQAACFARLRSGATATRERAVPCHPSRLVRVRCARSRAFLAGCCRESARSGGGWGLPTS